jgi:hypothetical protein
MADLVAAKHRGVPFLARQVKPREEVSREQMAKLLGELEARSFARREKATADLLRLGPLAGRGLRDALQARPSLELKRRMERVLEELDQVRDVATLRTLRAVEVLEGINTPESRSALERLAGGASGAHETTAARAALAHLASAHRSP